MSSLRAAVAAALTACAGSPSQPAGDAPMADDAAHDAAPPAKLIAYVSGNGPDLAWFDVGPTGALAPAGKRATFAANPSFLAVAPDGTALYAASEATSRIGAYAIEPATGALTFLNDASSGGSGPAHLAVDRGGKFVLVANYGDGAVAVLPIGAGGRVGAPQQVLTPGANAHLIITDPSNRYAFVPCLGSNHVAQYLFDAATGTLTPNVVPVVATAAGAGPRHLAFAPDGKHAYLINEKDSTLTALALDDATGRLTPLQTLTTRAAGASGPNTTAEVWVHPNGKWVYGSNRGDDNIVQYAIEAGTGKLALVGHTPTGGRTPRDFTLDPTGRFLYAANQQSNSVVGFALDPATGTPAPTGASITAPAPSFVGVIGLPK